MRVMQPDDIILTVPAHCERQIVLVGASVRAAAQSAKAAGFDVLGIDLFGDPDTRKACKSFLRVDELLADDLAALSNWVDPDTPLMIVGGLEQAEQVVSQLERWTQLVGASLHLQRQMNDPAFLAEIAEASGVHFPNYLNTRPSPSNNFDKSRWLVKRPNSSGGLGVRWASEQEDAGEDTGASSECRENDQSIACNFYWQRWIDGRPYGASFLCDDTGVHGLGVCRSMFTRNSGRPFVYAGSYGPVILPAEVRESMLAVAHKIVERTDYRGLLNVDFVVDGRGRVWLLEINPRWSGSSEIIERSLRAACQIADGDSLLGLSTRALAGGATTLSTGSVPTFSYLTRRSVHLKRIIYAQRGGQFRKASLQGIDRSVVLADVPHDGSVVVAGAPLLTVIVKTTERDSLSWQKQKRLFANMQRAVVS